MRGPACSAVTGVQTLLSSHMQIIYSSRTHSQIAQFIGEIRRSPYGMWR